MHRVTGVCSDGGASVSITCNAREGHYCAGFVPLLILFVITLARLKQGTPIKVSTQKTGVGRRDQGERGVSRQGGGGKVRSSQSRGFGNLLLNAQRSEQDEEGRPLAAQVSKAEKHGAQIPWLADTKHVTPNKDFF